MNPKLPLSGIRVVELATVVATPLTGRLLSDYGAQVIKIESPSGDILRPMGTSHQLPIEDNNNPLFDLCNSGKRFIALNLKTKEGMTAFFRLLTDADIFLSNVRMKSLERMGIDYSSLSKRFPRLIYAHFSGFGLKGEERDRPGYDSTAFWMRSGASTDISTPGAFPLRPSFAFGDIATASGFLSAILMAVIGRERTGRGTMVATSLLQSGVWCNSVAVMNAQPQYSKQYPVERYRPGNPLTDYYECADGEYVAIMQNDYEKDRRLYAEVFGLTELLTDPDLKSVAAMRSAGKIPSVARHMQETIRQKSSMEWETILTAHDIPHEVSGHFRKTYQDPQAIAMGSFDMVDYPGNVTTSIPRPPFDFSAYDRKPFEKAGIIGADTAEVLTSLGYSEKDVREMIRVGAAK